MLENVIDLAKIIKKVAILNEQLNILDIYRYLKYYDINNSEVTWFFCSNDVKQDQMNLDLWPREKAMKSHLRP